eukprot:TRINITY_DN4583_c0_g4_i1.p2 TRINITY_DN4583_c0_g4~~TRINITY_DN4583_c0_g4_i1.p2  ORF type:complete len:351 (+),score=96.31 TRINITY_DN4583_c0_g4_i1:72-1124(+)
MQLSLRVALCALLALHVTGALHKGQHHDKHHRRHHHHRHHSHDAGDKAIFAQNSSTGAANATAKKANSSLISTAQNKTAPFAAQPLAHSLAAAIPGQQQGQIVRGRIVVNGPTPVDFEEHFAKAVAAATGCQEGAVKVVGTRWTDNTQKVEEVDFEGPVAVIHSVEDQASDPYSHLSNGVLRPFLVAGDGAAASFAEVSTGSNAQDEAADAEDSKCAQPPCEEEPAPPACPAPCAGSGIDIDTEMPYGDLEPFGREDTAQELTESSITESDEMVDQLERAEVAEEKRAVFRALTRLRGAAITSFDGIARSQTGNIDEYNKVHKWRMTHPLRHLADEESDITKWAFPDNAD